MNKPAENDNEVITKAYVDQLHKDNERNRRDSGLSFHNEEVDLVKNNQDNGLNDNKLTNLDSIIINRNPISDNEVSNKKYIDDELDKNTILIFNQTLENYLKVSAGNDTYNLTKFVEIQLFDLTEIKYPNIDSYFLPKWNIKNLHKNNGAKVGKFLKSTITSSPRSESRASSVPPIGNSFMYIETSSKNHGHGRAFVSWERTDINQISNILFYYNRFSILTNDSLKSMGRFRIQQLLKGNTWSTQNTIAQNDRYNYISTDWTLLNLDFTLENYGNKLIYDQIATRHADMCFSNFTTTHSVY